MTDRELLELAAKAENRAIGVYLGDGNGFEAPFFGEWNPLINDGDALRLAVILISEHGFELKEHNDAACFQSVDYGAVENPWAGHGGDRYSATRRAIVRAAAEVGKAMP